MFDFIYRIDDNWALFYDGSILHAKQCFDYNKAIDWYAWCKRFVEYEISIYNKKVILKTPVSEWWWVDITNELKVFLYNAAKSKKIDDLLIRNRWEFLKEFDCVLEQWQVLFKYREAKRTTEIDSTLLHMKNFEYWMWRLSDIHNKKWQIVPESYHYFDWNKAWEDYHNLKYEYNWKEYQTPLYWLYVPHMIQTLFSEEDPLPSGKYLQKRQSKFMRDAWQVNFLFHSRRWWKTLLLQLMQFLLLKCERPSKWFKKMLINYFCQSAETFSDMTEYIKAFCEIYWWDNYIWKQSENSLIYQTYEGWKPVVIASVRFRTWLSVSKGRWWTPYAIIIDEASRQPQEVYNTALANVRLNKALLFCLTTVNYDEERDWCYEEAMRAYFASMAYEPMEDTVVKLWRKYWMEKISNVEEAKKNIKKFESMRNEFLEQRRYSCNFFTIEDIEYITEEEKRSAIKDDEHKWDKFILAEYFSIFADAKKIFNWHSYTTTDLPDKFEHIFFSRDQALKFDNSALSIIWVNDYNIYIIDSIILPQWRLDLQVQRIKELMHEYRFKIKEWWKLRLVVDVTQSWWDLSSVEWKWLYIDCPMYSTWWNNAWYHVWRQYNVSKNFLISNVREAFSMWYIKINQNANWIDWKDWLLREMDNFWPDYKAIRWKDDQVLAMVMWIHYIYSILLMKKILFEKDEILLSKRTMSEEELLKIIKQQKSEPVYNYSIINYQ